MTLIGRPGLPHFARALGGMNYTFQKHSGILASAVHRMVRQGPQRCFNHYYPLPFLGHRQYDVIQT
jgi:hypothetical protein